MARRIYVEIEIATTMDRLWEATQDPRAHVCWDARFSEIALLPAEPEAPRRFRYVTQILPGLTIVGVGISVGERNRPDGTRTSALRFASDHPLSLVRRGAGYWRYVPTATGIRFLTGYDYDPGWGRVGRGVDRVFRPFFGWLTAWSFDRLRLWVEHGVPPRRALGNAVGDLAARVAAVAVVAVATGSIVVAVLAGIAAVVVPALPSTPRAQRCRRRPVDRHTTAPDTLARLGTP